MKYQALLDQMKAVRGYLLHSADGLNLEQLVRVPPGFRNSILWNIGHVVTDNCTMLYPPANLPFPLPDHYLRWFAPGTSPEDWSDVPSVAEILNAGARMRDQIVEDCTAGRMENYSPWTTEQGFEVTNIAYAIAHCNTHEAIHLGVIMSLRKLV